MNFKEKIQKDFNNFDKFWVFAFSVLSGIIVGLLSSRFFWKPKFQNNDQENRSSYNGK